MRTHIWKGSTAVFHAIQQISSIKSDLARLVHLEKLAFKMQHKTEPSTSPKWEKGKWFPCIWIYNSCVYCSVEGISFECCDLWSFTETGPQFLEMRYNELKRATNSFTFTQISHERPNTRSKLERRRGLQNRRQQLRSQLWQEEEQEEEQEDADLATKSRLYREAEGLPSQDHTLFFSSAVCCFFGRCFILNVWDEIKS